MKVGVIISAIAAVIGSFIGSGAWIGTPIAQAAGGALSATLGMRGDHRERNGVARRPRRSDFVGGGPIAQGRLAGDLIDASVGWTAAIAALVVGIYTAGVRSPAPRLAS